MAVLTCVFSLLSRSEKDTLLLHSWFNKIFKTVIEKEANSPTG